MWQFPTVTTSQHHHHPEAPDLQEQLRRIWQLRAVYIMPLGLSTTGIIPKNYTTVSTAESSPGYIFSYRKQ